MESYGFATINDKLDVFRIDTKGIHWLEQSSEQQQTPCG